jgi:acyl-coenzyme A synthetase/AMP-(fatty) acid ligase
MTLIDVLVRAVSEAPGQHIVHVDGAGAERVTTYAELYADALRVAGGLRAAGLAKGDPMLLVCDDSAEFLSLFWGAVVAGVVPVPLTVICGPCNTKKRDRILRTPGMTTLSAHRPRPQPGRDPARPRAHHRAPGGARTDRRGPSQPA